VARECGRGGGGGTRLARRSLNGLTPWVAQVSQVLFGALRLLRSPWWPQVRQQRFNEFEAVDGRRYQCLRRRANNAESADRLPGTRQGQRAAGAASKLR